MTISLAKQKRHNLFQSDIVTLIKTYFYFDIFFFTIIFTIPHRALSQSKANMHLKYTIKICLWIWAYWQKIANKLFIYHWCQLCVCFLFVCFLLNHFQTRLTSAEFFLRVQKNVKIFKIQLFIRRPNNLSL